MNILQLARCDPYKPTNGRERRVWETAKKFSEFGDVWLATPSRTMNHVASDIHPLPLPSKFLNNKLAIIYLWNAALSFGWSNHYQRAMTRRVVGLINRGDVQFNLVVSESPQMLAAAMELSERHDAAFLLNKHNAAFELLASYLKSTHIPESIQMSAIEALQNLEQTGIKAADAVVFQSDLDLEKFNVPEETVCEVIPNGTNYEAFREGDARGVARKFSFRDDRPVCVFVGSYDYDPNRSAAEFIDTAVAPSLPKVTFLLAGRDPPSTKASNVEAIGFVEDLPGFLSLADIALCPLFSGSGTKLKMLDYLAAGLPVVTTPVGAQGLPLKDGETALIETEADGFVVAIKSLLDSPGMAQRLRLNGQSLAAEYDWNTLLKGYEDVVANI